MNCFQIALISLPTYDEHFPPCSLFCSQQVTVVVKLVKNPPVMQETWVRSLGWEVPLEEGVATYSSIPARRIPWTEEPGWAAVPPFRGCRESDSTARLQRSTPVMGVVRPLSSVLASDRLRIPLLYSQFTHHKLSFQVPQDLFICDICLFSRWFF